MIYVSYISLRICLNASHQQVFFYYLFLIFFKANQDTNDRIRQTTDSLVL